MGKRIFALVVLALFLYVTSPLLFPLAMGVVLAILVHPLFLRMERRRVPPFAASTILTLGVTLLFLLPVTFVFFFIAKTGFQQLQAWKDAPKSGVGFIESVVNTPAITKLMEKLVQWFPMERQQILDTLAELVRNTGLKLADVMGGVMTKLPGAFMAIAVIVVSIYFFLVEGKRLVQLARHNSVFTPAQTDHLLHWTASVCRSVVLASVVAGMGQALVEMVFCAALSVPNIPLIGGLVFVASFVPLIGSAPITLGVALNVFLLGRMQAGVTLLIAALLVMVLDNLIRPIFLKGSANLHPLLAFVAAFGGLQTIGMLGVFLGPIVAAIFVATLQIVLEER